MAERLHNIYPTREQLLQEVRATLELLIPEAMKGTGFLTLSKCYYLWNRSDDQVNTNTIKQTIDLCHKVLSMKEESGLDESTIYHTQQLLKKLNALNSLYNGQLTFSAVNFLTGASSSID